MQSQSKSQSLSEIFLHPPHLNFKQQMMDQQMPHEAKTAAPTVPVVPVTITPQTGRVKRNWQIYSLYARGEHDDCLKVIEEQLNACKGQAEYPLYVKGLILRERGQVQDSLQLFQAATVINPTNMANLKQVRPSHLVVATKLTQTRFCVVLGVSVFQLFFLVLSSYTTLFIFCIVSFFSSQLPPPPPPLPRLHALCIFWASTA